MYQPLADALRARPYVEFLDGTSENVQFYSTNTDRVKAMETLLEHLGLTFDNVMSVGDSMGMDASMVSRAALGVAMENGEESVCRAARFIAPHHAEGGVGKFLFEKVLL